MVLRKEGEKRKGIAEENLRLQYLTKKTEKDYGFIHWARHIFMLTNWVGESRIFKTKIIENNIYFIRKINYQKKRKV